MADTPYIPPPDQPEDYINEFAVITFEHLWNYPRERHLPLLKDMLEAGEPPRFSIFYGDPGSGKSAVAYLMGMWASCEKWKDNNLWCGTCPKCRTVMTGRHADRWGFYEVNATAEDAMEHIHNARNNSNVPEGYSPGTNKGDIHDSLAAGASGDNPRPTVTLIDEVQYIQDRPQEKLLDLIKKWPYGIVIMATTNKDKINNALLSRAGDHVYEFTYPLPEEVAANLIRIAALKGSVMDHEVGLEIASRCNCEPRACLSKLQVAVFKLKPHITMEGFIKVFGPRKHPGTRGSGRRASNI